MLVCLLLKNKKKTKNETILSSIITKRCLLLSLKKKKILSSIISRKCILSEELEIIKNPNCLKLYHKYKFII